MSRGFPDHKNTFLTRHANILTFQRWVITSAGSGRPSGGHWEEEQERERKMCILVIIERRQTLRCINDGHGKESQ